MLDANGDNRDDLLIWSAERWLRLLLNDGVGGFVTETLSVPPQDIGHHVLPVDLDDGRLEVVSTALADCQDGQAAFVLYSMKAGELQKRRGFHSTAVSWDCRYPVQRRPGG